MQGMGLFESCGTATTEPPATVAAAPRATPEGARLRALAEPLGRKIEGLRGNRLENTPKRQCQGMSARCEAANLERVQRALFALADGWDDGSIPRELRGLKTRAAVEPLVTKIIEHPSYYVVCESDKFRSNTPEAEQLRAFVASKSGDRFAAGDREQWKRDQVRRLEESIRFTPIPGFFPTPPDLIEAMLAAADLAPGLKVLEPSAGKGDLAEAIDAAGCNVVCFEVVRTLADICTAKGLACDCGDFLKMHPVGAFDRVIMNPPFEKLQDAAHVHQAFEWLKPGGRLVSIMSSGAFFNSRAQGFRDWLDTVDHTIEDNDPDAFKGAFRSTGVSTKLVVIEKR